MTTIEYLLFCLAEECNEVAQRAIKGQRFTLNEIQPGQPLTNLQRLGVELDDLHAVVRLLREYGVAIETSEERIQAKMVKLKAFMEYSKELGVIFDMQEEIDLSLIQQARMIAKQPTNYKGPVKCPECGEYNKPGYVCGTRNCVTRRAWYAQKPEFYGVVHTGNIQEGDLIFVPANRGFTPVQPQDYGVPVEVFHAVVRPINET